MPRSALRAMSYLPFVPPNVAGFPKGSRLLGPSNLVHTFDLVRAVRRRAGGEVGGRPLRALRPLRRERHHAGGGRAPSAIPTSALRPRRHLTGVRPRMSDPARDHRRGELGISRRRFLTGLGVAGTAAVTAGYGLSVWRDGGSSATSSPASSTTFPRLGAGRSDRTLVVVELAGGNDGLNTVVPIADPAYRALRPTLGVTDAARPRRRRRPAPEADQARGALPGGSGRDRRRRRLPGPRPLALRFARGTGGRGPRGTATSTGWLGSLPRRHRRVRRSARRGRHRAGAVARVARDAVVRDDASPTSAASSRGFRRGSTHPTTSWPRGRGFAPATPDPSTVMGELQRAITLTVARPQGAGRDAARRVGRAHRRTGRVREGRHRHRRARARGPARRRRPPTPRRLRERRSATTTPTRARPQRHPAAAGRPRRRHRRRSSPRWRGRGRGRPGPGDDGRPSSAAARPRTAAAPTTAPPLRTSSSGPG